VPQGFVPPARGGVRFDSLSTSESAGTRSSDKHLIRFFCDFMGFYCDNTSHLAGQPRRCCMDGCGGEAARCPRGGHPWGEARPSRCVWRQRRTPGTPKGARLTRDREQEIQIASMTQDLSRALRDDGARRDGSWRGHPCRRPTSGCAESEAAVPLRRRHGCGARDQRGLGAAGSARRSLNHLGPRGRALGGDCPGGCG